MGEKGMLTRLHYFTGYLIILFAPLTLSHLTHQLSLLKIRHLILELCMGLISPLNLFLMQLFRVRRLGDGTNIYG